ncbi:MAG: NAD(+) synthase [Oscillospiraceae bacterium]|nr:NAD(+) synthase [Oscillospiraceae bacterium]
MKDGFLRVAAATPDIKVADCDHNADEIIRLAKEACKGGASVIVFPELCITGYTCGDLFLQKVLLDGAKTALIKIAAETAKCNALIVVGLPFEMHGKLYNCAAALNKGEIIGLVPKKNIPAYSEFYEARHFTPWQNGGELSQKAEIADGLYTLFGDIIFECKEIPELVVGIEVCEDLWVPEPPSAKLAISGATLICNPSASDEVIGKGDYRVQLVKSQSARLVCGYIYADAGMGESTQDLVFCGHNLICENGTVIGESRKFTTGITYGEIDLHRLVGERGKMNTFPCRKKVGSENSFGEAEFSIMPKNLDLKRRFEPMPFVPTNKTDLNIRCEEILTMQATGLATRLRHIGCKTAVIGLSGGLDSTLALIVTVHAFDMLALDRKGITAVTMPCFGTTKRTKSNAYYLAEAYGVTLKEVDITAAVRRHFEDIGQDEAVLDVTFENGQARERTQVLMDIANKLGGIVIGTGDLSELALGWATYNGDHMSMYGVNASVPKTLVRHLVAYESANTENAKLAEVLNDVLATPVSPELLPPSDGEISQKTEDIVGPYELHDYFLYYLVRCGYPPKKILRIAEQSFEGTYSKDTIKKWLTVFLRRFFSQQFKRSCLPDGPKVGTVTLSPRGDWRMPSDACVRLWLEDLEK